MQNCINFKLFQNKSWEKSRKSCKINCWQRQLRILWSSACTVWFAHSAAGTLHSWHKNVFLQTTNCICPNRQMHLSKLQHVLVLLARFGLVKTLNTPVLILAYFGWAATFCLQKLGLDWSADEQQMYVSSLSICGRASPLACKRFHENIKSIWESIFNFVGWDMEMWSRGKERISRTKSHSFRSVLPMQSVLPGQSVPAEWVWTVFKWDRCLGSRRNTWEQDMHNPHVDLEIQNRMHTRNIRGKLEKQSENSPDE